MKKEPKVLLLDIETSPILGHLWGLWDQNLGLTQIEDEWFVLSWAAKWWKAPESEMMYESQRYSKNKEDDKKILKKIWKLLDEADIVVGQNSKRFDTKKLNARFIMHGMQPPSSYKQIDTLQIAKKYFAFTSNKLAWMTDKLNKKNKKSDHKKFSGFELWKECLAGNDEAWLEMEKYNKKDVTSLEELFERLIPWDSTINFNLYTDEATNSCKCGSDKFIKKGFAFTSTGKYQKYRCKKCGAETRGRNNLFSKEKVKSLRVNSGR